MERKLNELANLVEKLNDRIIKAKESNAISAIETDIMLHLLRQCYLVTEQLKTTESDSEKPKSEYVAPVVQVIQESREVQHEKAGEVTHSQAREQAQPAVESYSKTEEVIVVQPEPAEENDDFQTEHVGEFIAPQSVPVEEFNIPQPEPVEEVNVPQPKPVEEVNVPQPEPEPQIMLPIEEIPVMSFAKVEVPHDIQPDPQSHIDESSTTNIYSAVGAIAPITPEPAEPVKSDYQSHAGTYSRDTNSDRQASISSSQQNTQSSSFNQKQDTITPMKTARQTGDLFGGQTIADKLKNEAPSLIDKINEGRQDQTLAHKMQLKPINDLKTAIGINEKFQFVNDLFEGRIDLYNDAISRLNNCGSAFSADSIMDEYLAAHGWNTNAEAYVKLRTFITRRYL